MRAVLVVVLAVSVAGPAAAQGQQSPIFSPGPRFVENTGQTLYAESCQDCHMADGKGAAGAGRYPALAGNPKLEVSGYPLTVVLHGLDGMPPIGRMMSDAQVAAVVNYVRTHFGNNYSDPVTAEDVASAR